MSATQVADAADAIPLQIGLLPRPGKERQEYERTGIMPPLADSVLELTWCVAKSISDDLKRTGLKLHMLVVVSQDGKEMSRELIPFEKGYHYLRFYRPGKNIVHVTGVWRTIDDLSDLLETDKRDRYRMGVLANVKPGVERIRSEIRALNERLDRFPPRRREAAIEDEQSELTNKLGELYDQMYRLEAIEPEELRITLSSLFGRLDYEAREEVEVDPRYFAQLSPVTTWLANVWPKFRADSSPDSCTTKRRAWVYTLPTMWAYGVFLLLKSIVALATLGFGLFMGFRDLDPKPVWQPWRKTRGYYVIPYGPSSIWFADGEKEVRMGPVFFINPPVVTASAVVASIVTFIWARSGPRLGWTDRFTDLWAHGPWWFIPVVILGPAGIALSFYALAVMSSALGVVANTSPFARMREALRNRREQKVQEEEEEYRQRVEMLTCNSGDVLKAPRPKPPLVLSYSEIKARYCKPHARL